MDTHLQYNGGPLTASVDIVDTSCTLKLTGKWNMYAAYAAAWQAFEQLDGLFWKSLTIDCSQLRSETHRSLETSFVAYLLQLLCSAIKHRAAAKPRLIYSSDEQIGTLKVISGTRTGGYQIMDYTAAFEAIPTGKQAA